MFVFQEEQITRQKHDGVNVRSRRGDQTARGRVTRTCDEPCQPVLAKQMLIHGLSGHVSRVGRLVELADFVRLSSCSSVILLPSL